MKLWKIVPFFLLTHFRLNDLITLMIKLWFSFVTFLFKYTILLFFKLSTFISHRRPSKIHPLTYLPMTIQHSIRVYLLQKLYILFASYYMLYLYLPLAFILIIKYPSRYLAFNITITWKIFNIFFERINLKKTYFS